MDTVIESAPTLVRECRLQDSKIIPLSGGLFALVDAADYDVLKCFKWHVRKTNTTFYASTRIGKKQISMHRFLLKPDAEISIDHINGDGLDNRRQNLRFATAQQNMFNQGKRANTSSRFKGVTLMKKSGKWRASIRGEGRLIVIGHFETEFEAALSYDSFAIYYFGKFARLNVHSYEFRSRYQSNHVAAMSFDTRSIYKKRKKRT